MDDLISRQVVANFLSDWLSCLDENCHKQSVSDLKMIIKDFKNLPSVQPDITTDGSNVVKKGRNDADRTSGDCISRQAAIDTLRRKA